MYSAHIFFWFQQLRFFCRALVFSVDALEAFNFLQL
jgi:hypothetical protein